MNNCEPEKMLRPRTFVLWGTKSEVLVVLLAVVLAVLLAGCGGKKATPALSFRGEVRDLSTFPQQLGVYAQNAEGSKNSADANVRSRQADFAQNYKEKFFAPWGENGKKASKKDFNWAISNFSAKTSYTADGREVSPAVWQSAASNANGASFPSLGFKGVTVANTLLRALPTNQPFYLNPKKPGEGPPFDYLQYSTLWVGTPVFVRHASKDSAWLYCETAFVSGWASAADVAEVTPDFVSSYQRARLLAVMSDSFTAHVAGARPVTLRIGTLLPDTGAGPSLPVKAGQGATLSPIPVGHGSVQPFPVSLTPQNIAALGNQMMGRPYGWGGLDYERDCSSLLRDLFTPFGLWLPRNSSKQILVGNNMSLAGLDSSGKVNFIVSNGVPFTTLIGMPGHIGLYLGEYKGVPVMLHSVWGAKTRTASGDGRLVIGKVVVTSLEPGKEYTEVQNAGTLINRVSAITNLVY